jgi:DNA invertase Pin-like site-specific DNA recombinase
MTITSSEKMRAATYLRVSRSDQSSRLQADETSELVKRRGWSLARSFVDDGISGATAKRPAFRELLDAARRREFDVLVVYRSDRLFRSLRELLATLDELGELGIGFVSVHEPFDTTTSAGRLLLQVVGAFAEFERNVLRERTKSGLDAARRRGAKVGRPRRYVDVQRALMLKQAGKSWPAIARELAVPERTLARAVRAASLN